ncbi:MAG: radical SAM protein [Candidatus Omnitrophica bacterium]|nr:radical SAM protein [Candidatus Omnitrophota bacterium]
MAPKTRYNNLGEFYDLPLGLAYISSALRKHGHNVAFVNEHEQMIIHGDNYTNWLNATISRNEVFCIGGLSSHYHEIKRLINHVKSVKPDIKIIVGGGIISSEPELMSAELGCDQCVVGEGEDVIIDIISGKIKDKIVYAKTITDIDSISFPDYDGLLVNNYLDRQLCGDCYYFYQVDKPRALPIISSRSCPFRCSFCFSPIGKKYRQRSIENLCTEIEMLKSKYNINILAICDELISLDTERLEKICAALKRFDVKWTTQMRVSQATEPILRMMKDSGCINISFGIEHVNDTVLNSMRKKTTRAQIENALSAAHDVGMGIQGNILFGDPAETYEMLADALVWWKNNIRYGLNLSRVSAYPGTEIYKKYVESGKIPDKMEFIKQNCPFIIPTSYDFNKSENIIADFKNYNNLPAQVVSKVKTKIDKYRGQLYDVGIKCFHCNHISNYVDLYVGAGSHGGSDMNNGHGYRIGCKHCNQRTDFRL